MRMLLRNALLLTYIFFPPLQNACLFSRRFFFQKKKGTKMCSTGQQVLYAVCIFFLCRRIDNQLPKMENTSTKDPRRLMTKSYFELPKNRFVKRKASPDSHLPPYHEALLIVFIIVYNIHCCLGWPNIPQPPPVWIYKNVKREGDGLGEKPDFFGALDSIKRYHLVHNSFPNDSC